MDKTISPIGDKWSEYRKIVIGKQGYLTDNEQEQYNIEIKKQYKETGRTMNDEENKNLEQEWEDLAQAKRCVNCKILKEVYSLATKIFWTGAIAVTGLLAIIICLILTKF